MASAVSGEEKDGPPQLCLSFRGRVLEHLDMQKSPNVTRPNKAPSFKGLHPSTKVSSETKRNVRASGTKAEMALRRELWGRGLRYRLRSTILGRPDIVFPGARVAVFCDGDFFHGRNWAELQEKLKRRANAGYWLAKITYNRDRDRLVNEELHRAGWRLLRFWETDILADPGRVATEIQTLVGEEC